MAEADSVATFKSELALLKSLSWGSSVPVYDSSVFHCSKPTDNLRIIIGNMNSIKERKAQLKHLCATTGPNIILACEIKMDKTIKHTEFLLANYTCHIRLDRTNRGGGVMICRAGRSKSLTRSSSSSPALQTTMMKMCGHGWWSREPAPCTLAHTTGHVPSKTHIRNNTHATIMMGGGFNVADIDWESNTSRQGSPCKLWLAISCQQFMVPRNGHQGSTVCRLLTMSDKHTATEKIQWNGNFEAKNIKNSIKSNHGN